VAEENDETEGGAGAKIALQQLVKDTVKMGQTAGLSLSEVQGIAFCDTRKDEKIRSLMSFATGASKIVDLPHFIERFGAEAAPRIALQFVYQYFERNHVMNYSEEIFETTFDDLIKELDNPVWIFRGVTNLRYFNSGVNHIDLDDGVTIRGRSSTDLASLGFGTAIWDRMTEDWRGFGASSFVLIAEHSIPKKPDNLILTDTYRLSLKAGRAILALRFAAKAQSPLGRCGSSDQLVSTLVLAVYLQQGLRSLLWDPISNGLRR